MTDSRFYAIMMMLSFIVASTEEGTSQFSAIWRMMFCLIASIFGVASIVSRDEEKRKS